MRNLLVGVTICLTASFAHSLSWAATQAQMSEAQQLLTASKPQQALSLLEASHAPTTASTQEFFLLGVAAKQSGDLAKSEGYFRSAVAREPSAGRIRLELAEVLYRQGKLDDSRSELVTVRNTNPPKKVRENIDGFIAQVDAVKANPSRRPQGPQKNWSAYITAGFTSDSNVNAGPTTDTVFLYGLPFTLSSGAQETQDTAFFVRTGMNHQFELENGAIWRSSANLGLTNYFSADAYDTTTLSASSGPAFKLGGKVGFSIPITFDAQRYNSQSGWYSQSWGIAPRFQYAAKPNLQIYVDTSAVRKRFVGNAARNLTAYTLNPSLNYQPYKDGNIALGLQFGRESSGQDIYSNDVRGVYLGYQHAFKETGVRASITASYTDTQFDGIQAAYTKARHDVSQKISGSVSYALPQLPGADITGSASYQNNDSNLDINKYERTEFSLSITKRF